MQAEKLHSIVPAFKWHWWQIWLFAFVINWVIIQIVLKGLEPRKWGPPLGKSDRVYWWSALYGDLFLPIGIASSIVTLRTFPAHETWYTSFWWNWTVFIGGFVIITLLDAQAKYTRRQLLMPSRLWHAYIAFPICFYLSLMTIIPMLVTHKPVWAVVLALFGYDVWGFTWVHDVFWPPDASRTH